MDAARLALLVTTAVLDLCLRAQGGDRAARGDLEALAALLEAR